MELGPIFEELWVGSIRAANCFLQSQRSDSFSSLDSVRHEARAGSSSGGPILYCVAAGAVRRTLTVNVSGPLLMLSAFSRDIGCEFSEGFSRQGATRLGYIVVIETHAVSDFIAALRREQKL